MPAKNLFVEQPRVIGITFECIDVRRVIRRHPKLESDPVLVLHPPSAVIRRPEKPEKAAFNARPEILPPHRPSREILFLLDVVDNTRNWILLGELACAT